MILKEKKDLIVILLRANIAKVTRDILAVPATTVASEAAFSIGGRVIDENRACLLP